MSDLGFVHAGASEPWKFEIYGDGSTTLSGYVTSDLLDQHPDFLWFDGTSDQWKSIGTSLFLGPELPRHRFQCDLTLYVPESVKWNRFLYYAMDDPQLFECLPDVMCDRIYDHLCFHDMPLMSRVNGLYGLDGLHVFDEEKSDEQVELKYKAGVWSIWGRCPGQKMDGFRCLDVHECVDLHYEINMHHTMLQEARKRPHDDEYFYMSTQDANGTKMFGHYYGPGEVFSQERRSKAISNWKDLKILVIAQSLGGQGGDKLLRECVEAQFAWTWKALYWNRTYFQAVTKRMLRSQLKVENVLKKT